ncbi:MAG: HEAT repeat domain-containing protein [Bryobacteraceae bacterium]
MLSELYQAGPDDTRKPVCGAAAKIDRPDSLGLLKSALCDKNKDVRQAAVSVIGEVNSPAPHGALREALQDANAELQGSAMKRLSEQKVAEVRPEIAAILGSDGGYMYMPPLTSRTWPVM